MFTKTIAAVLAAASLAYAAPTPSTPTTGTVTAVIPVDSAVVTHRVAVGLGGLKYEPANIRARVGEIVEFKFLSLNHSVAQSSFAQPCKPLVDPVSGVQTGFFAGFDFFQPVQGTLAPNVYQIEIVDDTIPIWFYCPQTTGNHCQKGMSGVINQNDNSPNTLAAYQAAAALTGTSIVPAYIQGGLEGPNPNPNSGFP